MALIVTAHPGIDHDNIAATRAHGGLPWRHADAQRAAARPPATDLPVPRAEQIEPTEVAA